MDTDETYLECESKPGSTGKHSAIKTADATTADVTPQKLQLNPEVVHELSGKEEKKMVCE